MQNTPLTVSCAKLCHLMSTTELSGYDYPLMARLPIFLMRQFFKTHRQNMKLTKRAQYQHQLCTPHGSIFHNTPTTIYIFIVGAKANTAKVCIDTFIHVTSGFLSFRSKLRAGSRLSLESCSLLCLTLLLLCLPLFLLCFLGLCCFLFSCYICEPSQLL